MKLLGVSKGSFYYKPAPAKEDEDKIMKAIDLEHLEHPTKGVIGMRDTLVSLGIIIGVKRVRKLMRRMNINAIYPKRNLSKLGSAKYVMPYLLRHIVINHPNQVWSTDITYIPMRKGFMYLYAIIDVYSRYIVGWGLYSTLEASNAIEVLQRAVETYGVPEIINSDQGSQYTCPRWLDACKSLGITVSMDGKARCIDNRWIERFWWTIKQEYIYLSPCDTGGELGEGIRKYIEYYNKARCHQSLDHKTPFEWYQKERKAA